MPASWVVPLHDNCLVSGIFVMLQKTGRIGLLVDQSNGGTKPEQFLISLISQSQILSVDFGRHQWSDDLCIPAANEFAWAFRSQCPQFVNPTTIDFRNRVQRVGGRLNSKRQSMPSREPQKRPIAIADHLRPPLLVNRGVGQVQVKDREEIEGHLCPSDGLEKLVQNFGKSVLIFARPSTDQSGGKREPRACRKRIHPRLCARRGRSGNRNRRKA